MELAGALEGLGDPRAEPYLVAELAARRGPARHAVLSARGAVGTISSVEPLCALAEADIPASREERKAARRATRRIQSRLGHPAGGSLSVALAEATQGMLSEADDDDDGDGELSLTPAPGEQAR